MFSFSYFFKIYERRIKLDIYVRVSSLSFSLPFSLIIISLFFIFSLHFTSILIRKRDIGSMISRDSPKPKKKKRNKREIINRRNSEREDVPDESDIRRVTLRCHCYPEII